MRSYFATVALPLLLLFILNGSPRPTISVTAFPAAVTPISPDNKAAASNNPNHTFISIDTASTTPQTGELTEYPVFISVTEETQTAESEVVTESYMIVEDQEVDDDDDDDGDTDNNGSDSSTLSSGTMQSTTPMPSPKSSPEQEEVLRELKKLWDLSEGMSDTGNDALKTSLSSIVHLAYARVYIEPDETLMKLKYLLQQLQEKILLGTNLNGNESILTTEIIPSSSSSSNSADAESNYSDTNTNLMSSSANPAAGSINNEMRGNAKERRRRSIYDDNVYGNNNDVEAIFFANVNSEENSVIPEEKDHYQKLQQASQEEHVTVSKNGNATAYANISVGLQIKNDTKLEDPVSTSTPMSVVSTTTPPPSTVQKVVRINNRLKPMPSFYFLSAERINELKSRLTSSTTTTSTLSPISIVIDEELENEVNLLQQQQQVDNYDIHISSAETHVPLTTATAAPAATPSISSSSFYKRPLLGSTIAIGSTTELPYKPEDIALALFQLLRPNAFYDDESEDEGVTSQPHPSPLNILYQVGSLSSVLNFTMKAQNVSTSTMTTTTTAVPVKIPTPTTTTTLPLSSSSSSTTTTQMPTTTQMTTTTKLDAQSLLKLKDKYIKNRINETAPLLVPPPSALSDLGFVNPAASTITSILIPSTSTERQTPAQSNDIYDYTDVVDQKPVSADTSITTSIVQGTHEGLQQMVQAITGLSVGAKIVLLFSISISILSIGFGIFAVQPPLASIGVLGVVIPVVLLFLLETTGTQGGKRKLTTRQQQQLFIEKLQSEEFSKVVDMIFDAATKYSKG